MKYDKALKHVFATGIIADGYSEKTVKAMFSFIDGVTIAVVPCGCFRYSTPPAINVSEALWLLNHHPTSNAKQVKMVV